MNRKELAAAIMGWSLLIAVFIVVAFVIPQLANQACTQSGGKMEFFGARPWCVPK